MRSLQGYVTSKSFNGYALPVPIQNKLLRMYASENDMLYVLPQCELIIKDNHMALFDTVKKMEPDSDLGLCSIYMFPKEKNKIYKIIGIIKEKNITSHFIFEDTQINAEQLLDFFYEKNISNMIEFLNEKELMSLLGN